MTGQIPLDLRVPEAMGRDDFLESPSSQRALERIEQWPDWSHPDLAIVGPAGSGKTHLASIFCARSTARYLDAAHAIDESEEGFAGHPLVIDNIDRSALDDAMLFHRINATREAGQSLVVTMRAPLSNGGTGRLPDLVSRIGALPVVGIAAPDDALLRAVLVKLFADRQLAPDPSVIDYVLSRMERSPRAARDIVARLDREALASKHAVTRPMAVRVLAEVSEDA